MRGLRNMIIVKIYVIRICLFPKMLISLHVESNLFSKNVRSLSCDLDLLRIKNKCVYNKSIRVLVSVAYLRDSANLD